MERAFAEDACPWYAIARHMLGLYHGQRGGRLWRQVWSDHKLKPLPPREVWQLARAALARGVRPAVAVFSESLWPTAPAEWRRAAPRNVVLADALFADISALESPAAMGFVLDWPAPPRRWCWALPRCRTRTGAPRAW